MDFSIMVYAVIALVGVAIGWLFASYQHAQQKAEQFAEREEMVAELSAAKQQITQSEHWRAECELLNNEVRSLQSINTSLEADLREVTTRMEAAQQHADDKIRQMINSEQRLSEQFENLANRIFEHSNRRVDEQNRQSLVSIENDARSRMQPDVIVRLPQGKDVVIDAKMTLVAYERYFNAEDDYTRESALQEHIASVRNHIRLLGRKDYQQLPGLRTLDYVLMFIPVEPAFLLALDRQPELITEALKNNIMLVSPTTLLVALRTIANLWRYEHQSRNAQQIADRASKLYDKMRLFIDDMSAIGQSLDKAQDNYRQAMKKLSSGRGNVLAQAEAFRGLGVEIKREINPDLAEQAVSQDEEYRLRSVPEQPNDEAYQRDDEYNQQSR